MSDELSTMRSFQEPDTDGEIQHLRATIAALEADVQRWMEVALTQQPKIVRLEAEIEKLRADVVAWSHVAQEGNVGHGWSGTDPIWLAVPMPMFEKLGALLRSEK